MRVLLSIAAMVVPMALAQAQSYPSKPMRLLMPFPPDLPPITETVPGLEAKTFFGLLVPAGTPKDIVTRLNREAVRTLADAQTKERVVSRGFTVVGSTPAAFGEFLRHESELSGRLVRAHNITAE